MSDVTSEVALSRAAQAAYALLFDDCPYEPSNKPLEYFGPFAEVIKELREFHAKAIALTAKTGTLYDVYADALTLWEGLRESDDGHKQYRLLDREIRRLGDALSDTPRIKPWGAPKNGTKPHKPSKGQELINADQSPKAIDVTPRDLLPYSGDELMALDIPEPRQFVQGLLREGLAFFIGQPGVGKTPALIQLAIAFATGGLWFGVFRVPKIRVAYIGPEYDKGDVRSIIMASTGGRVALPNLMIFTVENFHAPDSEEEALNLIEHLITVLKVEAIIIDLFPGFLPPEKFKQNAYRGDYREFLAYHRTVLAHHVLLVGAWHGTKRDANPATMYNGGQGFWGAAGGGRLVMFQDEEEQVKLYSQLRGNKAITYSVTESHALGIHTWAILDGIEPEPALGSDVHRTIYRVIKENAPSHGLTPKTIYGLVRPELTTNASEAYIRKCLGVLVKRGILRAIGDAYVIASGSKGSEGSEVHGDQRDQRDRNGLLRSSDPSPILFPIPPDSASGSGETASDPSDPHILPIPEESSFSSDIDVHTLPDDYEEL